MFDEIVQAGAVAGGGERLAAGRDVHVAVFLGDVDADKGCRRRSGPVHGPSLQMRDRLVPSLATVRVHRHIGAKGAMLHHGLDHPRGKRAPLRPRPAKLSRKGQR